MTKDELKKQQWENFRWFRRIEEKFGLPITSDEDLKILLGLTKVIQIQEDWWPK